MVDSIILLLCILFVIVLYISPVIAGLCYLCSFFAWYHGLQKKSIVFLIIGLLFTVLAIYIYTTDWNSVFQD